MIYENIKTICAKKGISIAELEKKAGLGNGTVGKWKDSKSSPNVDTVLAIADALEVKVSTLMKS